MNELYPLSTHGCRAMVFVDGENLAIRYGAMVQGRMLDDVETAWYRADIAVWSQKLREPPVLSVVRKHYYTSVQGDDDKMLEISDWLKSRGFEAPRVFKKEKGRRSKQVDISLSTEMLLHGFRKHYEIAILVAGDEDYVPLVRAVQSEGARVHVWFVSNGISPNLKRASDDFVNLGAYFGI